MKHKQHANSWWNRALALTMVVLLSLQLTVPVFAQAEPMQQTGAAETLPESTVEASTEPAAPTETDPTMSPEQPQETEEETTAPQEETEATVPEEETETEATVSEQATEATDAEQTVPQEETQAPAAQVPQEDEDSELYAPKFAPVAIPGYTQVSTANLENGKYYLIVSQDSKGNLYALYPDQSGVELSSGNAINQAGTLVAALSVSGQEVTAKWEKDQSELKMEDLHFTVEKKDANRAFKSVNGLYLSVTEMMLSDSPSYFKIQTAEGSRYTLRNADSNRVLDFNKKGDPNQFTAGKEFETNFWGPRDAKFPIYLYTKDGVEAPVVVTGELRVAMDKAESMIESVNEASKAELRKAIDAAQAVLADPNVKQEQIDAALETLNRVMRNVVPAPEGIAPGAPAPGKTQGQPFAPGTGNSRNFRIPALITLKHQKNEALNGRVVAAIDARWNHMGDACALDTIVSVSDDDGANWNYSYANYFNDSTDAYHSLATAFIDPELVEGRDGTIYMMVDLFPGGVAINTAPRQPQKASGYQMVDGEKRLVLYTAIDGQTPDNWSYYVGDFQDGFAPVIARGDSEKKAAYYVDDHFYLYTPEKNHMYCQQLGSNQFVEQNVFYFNAELHVLDATYLWVSKSTDGGETWHDPMILNPQIRPDQGASMFYGVGPGAGICTEDGTIMLSGYTYSNQQCSFVYSSDHGHTWHRSETVENGGNWSSESALVEIDSKTVRQFYRDGFGSLRYTDHTKGSDGKWHVGEPVTTEAHKTTNNQLSAIRYSQTLGGKPMILVSTAAGNANSRDHGKIYTFVLESDNTMTLINTHSVTDGSYSYSSLAELEDGSIALLYEGNTIQYTVIPKEDIVKIEHTDLEMNCGDTHTFPAKATDTVTSSNSAVVDAQIVMEGTDIQITDGAQGRQGTDVSFGGELAPLSHALFRFVGSNETGFQITAKTADGTQVWLSTATNHYPSATSSNMATLKESENGTFQIYTNDRYLYFWRSGNHLATFDRVQNVGPECDFKIYRPAQAGEQQSELPGYVQVTKLSEIRDGGFYLIAASVGEDLYVLNPTTNQNNEYAQSLKVDFAAEKVTETVTYQEPVLTITAKTAGTAEVQMGNMVYHVTVSHKVGDAWMHDASGHWHGCSCGEKLDQAEHTFGEWTELKAPTEAETGLKVHSCTVCGYEETVEIPVVPVDPSKPDPTEPETTEPSEPETTEPSEPETTEPSEPETTEPSEPETTEPETTQPSEPGKPDPTEPETTQPSEPGKPDPTEPETTRPSESEKPSESTTAPTAPNAGNGPHTGDESHMLLWSVVAAISGICAVAAAICGKKKYQN